MRILYAFAAFVGAAWAVTGLTGGQVQDGLVGLAILIVAGGLLWRNLRDPEVTRKGGSLAQVTFRLEQGHGMAKKGTFAFVRTHKGNWDVTLDRTPERGDLDIYGTAHRGWVWLDPSGLPEKVRIDYGTTWKSWPVLEAVAATQTQVQTK